MQICKVLQNNKGTSSIIISQNVLNGQQSVAKLKVSILAFSLGRAPPPFYSTQRDKPCGGFFWCSCIYQLSISADLCHGQAAFRSKWKMRLCYSIFDPIVSCSYKILLYLNAFNRLKEVSQQFVCEQVELVADAEWDVQVIVGNSRFFGTFLNWNIVPINHIGSDLYYTLALQGCQQTSKTDYYAANGIFFVILSNIPPLPLFFFKQMGQPWYWRDHRC